MSDFSKDTTVGQMDFAISGGSINLPKLGGSNPECKWVTRTKNIIANPSSEGELVVDTSDWEDWQARLVCSWDKDDNKYYWFQHFIAQS